MRLGPGLRGTGRTRRVRPAINVLPIRRDDSQRPTPNRLRRVTDRWLPLGETSMIARITVLRHGGHDRPVITRGAKHSRFRFISDKTHTTQLGEGPGEEMLAYYNEVATEVVDYECHPFQIDLATGDGHKRYRPDAVRQLADGTVELIEVKRTERDLDDPEYRELLAAIAELCRICGWKFSVLHLEDIDPPGTERRKNVEGLYARRAMDLSREEDRLAGRLVATGMPITWRELRDRVSPGDPLHGDAVIERLLAGGMLSCDLDLPLTPSTVLTPARPFRGRSEIRL